MKIRLIEDVDETPAGSIVEVDEATGQALIDAGQAEVYTETVEEEEKKLAIKMASVQIITKKKEKKMENKTFENRKDQIVDTYGEDFVGKAFQSLATGKAVTGQSETTAADGGNLIYTAVSEVMGLALDGSKVWAKTPKITLPDRANAIKVPTDASDPWIKANVPTPTNPSEGTQKVATKVAFGAATLTLTKNVMYIPTTDELLQDAGMMDSYIRNYARGKLASVLDYEILAGGGGGYAAISGNANTTAKTITEATVTTAELYPIINAIDPRLQDGSEWFMSVGLWESCVGNLADADNLFKQLIDVQGKQLLGYPVTVMPSLNDIIIFGNLSQYQVAVPANNDIMSVSEHIRFDYDETVYRLVHRGAGEIVYVTKTTADSKEISAFAEGT